MAVTYPPLPSCANTNLTDILPEVLHCTTQLLDCAVLPGDGEYGARQAHEDDEQDLALQ